MDLAEEILALIDELEFCKDQFRHINTVFVNQENPAFSMTKLAMEGYCRIEKFLEVYKWKLKQQKN